MTATNNYMAMNAEILTSGYLRALEIYAETPGTVTFKVYVIVNLFFLIDFIFSFNFS